MGRGEIAIAWQDYIRLADFSAERTREKYLSTSWWRERKMMRQVFCIEYMSFDTQP